MINDVPASDQAPKPDVLIYAKTKAFRHEVLNRECGLQSYFSQHGWKLPYRRSSVFTTDGLKILMS